MSSFIFLTFNSKGHFLWSERQMKMERYGVETVPWRS